MKSNSRVFLYICYIVVIVIMVIMAEYFMNKKLQDKVVASIQYKEKSNVDYRVFYKENNYFDSAYIEKGNTYISSLISKIDVDFDYYLQYSEYLSGKYTYYVQASILATEANDASNIYWKKDYALTDKETISFENQESYHIMKSVTVDYQKFNELLKEFKNTLKLNTDSFLRVELVIVNSGNYAGLDEFQNTSNVVLSMPLTTNAIRMEIESDDTDEEKTISKIENNKKRNVWNMVVSGLCWFMCLLLSACFAVTYLIDMSNVSIYDRTLKKILTTYDSIIVTTEKLPSIKGMNVVHVTSFSELVDAQNEIRLPINFKENEKKKEAKFILIHDGIAWVFTLKEEN